MCLYAVLYKVDEEIWGEETKSEMNFVQDWIYTHTVSRLYISSRLTETKGVSALQLQKDLH